MRLEDHIGAWERRRAAIERRRHLTVDWVKIAAYTGYAVVLIIIVKWFTSK